MEALDSLYRHYLEEAAETARKKKPGEGIFGMGSRMDDEPCHDRFLERLEAFLQDLPAEQLPQALDTVYGAPVRYQDCERSAYWVLFAAHGLTLDRVEELQPQEAERLWQWYQKTFPRRERLPIQEKLLKALKQQSRK